MATKASATSKSKSTTTRRTTSGTTRPAAPKPAETAAPSVVTEAPAVVAGVQLKKRELIEKVVERSGAKKKFAKPAIEAMIDILAEAMAEGREVNLQPFGRIKAQRTKDTANARVIIAKIRQSKAAQPALDPEDRADADIAKEMVAEPAE